MGDVEVDNYHDYDDVLPDVGFDHDDYAEDVLPDVGFDHDDYAEDVLSDITFDHDDYRDDLLIDSACPDVSDEVPALQSGVKKKKQGSKGKVGNGVVSLENQTEERKQSSDRVESSTNDKQPSLVPDVESTRCDLQNATPTTQHQSAYQLHAPQCSEPPRNIQPAVRDSNTGLLKRDLIHEQNNIPLPHVERKKVDSVKVQQETDNGLQSYDPMRPISVQQDDTSIALKENDTEVASLSNYMASSLTVFNVTGNTGVTVLNQTETTDSVLKKILDQNKLRLERNLNNQLFVKTDTISQCEKQLKTWGMVTLTGGSGEGKTMAALYLLKHLSETDSRQPLILTDPSQWDLIPSSQGKDRFTILIDDAFGKTNLKADLQARWEQKFAMMLPLIESGNVCLIIVFRSTIFRLCEADITTYELFKRSRVVESSFPYAGGGERL